MKIDAKGIYGGLWKCRDFEIDHVWQRAVFLSAFLLACYAGYGSVIVGFATADKVNVSFRLINAICFFISFIGLLLSLVWIMMAKGSKAWYEHYESAIEAFESNCTGAFDPSCRQRVLLAEKTVPGFEIPSTSSWLWNTKGGAYSVAKINIVIGHLSTLVWLSVIGVHVAVASCGFESFREVEKWIAQYCAARYLMLVFVFGMLLFWIYSRVEIKSSYLKDRS